MICGRHRSHVRYRRPLVPRHQLPLDSTCPRGRVGDRQTVGRAGGRADKHPHEAVPSDRLVWSVCLSPTGSPSEACLARSLARLHIPRGNRSKEQEVVDDLFSAIAERAAMLGLCRSLVYGRPATSSATTCWLAGQNALRTMRDAELFVRSDMSQSIGSTGKFVPLRTSPTVGSRARAAIHALQCSLPTPVLALYCAGEEHPWTRSFDDRLSV